MSEEMKKTYDWKIIDPERNRVTQYVIVVKHNEQVVYSKKIYYGLIHTVNLLRNLGYVRERNDSYQKARMS